MRTLGQARSLGWGLTWTGFGAESICEESPSAKAACMGPSSQAVGLQKECLTKGVSQSECWVGILSLVVADVPGNTVISSLPELGDDKHWALPAFSCDPSRQGGGTWTRAWVKGGQ